MAARAMTKRERARLAGYINGFLGSVFLTMAAYLLVVQHTLSNHVLIGVIAILALIQFVVQLLCFLHMGTETRPRWKLAVFLFMIIIVVILVGGSLWIMANLNKNMNTKQVNQYLNSQDGL